MQMRHAQLGSARGKPALARAPLASRCSRKSVVSVKVSHALEPNREVF